MKNKLLERIYPYSILLLAFLVPSPLSGLTLPVLGIVFICWLKAGDYKNIPMIIKQPQVFFPLSIYLLMVAGLLYTAHPGKVFSGLSTQISFVVFPLIIGSSSILTKRLLQTLGHITLISISVFLLIAIGYAVFDTISTGQHSIQVGESIYSKFRSFGLTSVFRNWHPTYVAMFTNLGIAIQLQHCLESHRKRQVIVTALIVAFLGICLVLLNSLIGIACFVLILLFYYYQLSTQRVFNYKINVAVLSTFTAGLFVLFFFNPIKSEKIDNLKNKAFIITDNLDQRNVLTMRLAKWQTHVDIIKRYWLGGTTYGDINFIRKETYESNGYKDLAHYNYNAHNQYLEVLATYGIIGGIVFLGLLTAPLIYTHKYNLYLPFLIIVAVTFLTESVLVRQQGIQFFMFIYSLYTHRKIGD